MSASPLSVQAVCPTEEVASLQRLPYFLGISGASVGATGLSMHLGYETGIFVLEGTVLTRWGPNLENEVVSRPGEFLFIPPGVPHDATNLSATEPARAVVARNDPAEQDRVVPYTVCPPG